MSQDLTVKNKVGRPTLYREEFCDQVEEHMSKGYSKESCAGLLGISKQCLYEWIQKHDDSYIENYDVLKNVYNMFELTNNNNNLSVCEKIRIVNVNVDNAALQTILKEDGFIFPCEAA